MRNHILDFLRRGCASCGFGPLVLAVLYLSLQGQGVLQTLTINQVCTGIFSVTALAFIAGGMNAIYQVERLPLMVGVLIHGCVLYLAYLATYLLNGWLDWGFAPLLVFTGIFILGYLVIWAIIYLAIKQKTNRVNTLLKQQRAAQSE